MNWKKFKPISKSQSLKVRRKQLVSELVLEMKRVAGLAASANQLVDRTGKDIPAHPSHYALNRAWSALDDALKALEGK